MVPNVVDSVHTNKNSWKINGIKINIICRINIIIKLNGAELYIALIKDMTIILLIKDAGFTYVINKSHSFSTSKPHPYF